MSLKQEVLI